MNKLSDHHRQNSHGSGVVSGGGLGEDMSQDMKELVQNDTEEDMDDQNLQDSEPMQELEPNV